MSATSSRKTRVLLAVRLRDESAASTEICLKLAELIRRTYPNELQIEAGKGTLSVGYDDQTISISNLMQVAAKAQIRLAII